MKFFWKIFCSMIIITAVTLSIGGYLLIHSQFQSSLSREITAAYMENDILWQSMDQEFKSLDPSRSIQEQISGLAGDFTISTSSGRLSFVVSNENGTPLYYNCPLKGSADIFRALSPGSRGYEIFQQNGKYYIHAVRPLKVNDNILYLENFREATHLFDDKKNLYTTFTLLMAALFSGVGLAAFLLSVLLLAPLKKLSAATRQMAEGQFGQHFHITSRDEIGKLATDFEQMADRLDQMVNELKKSSRRQQDFINNFSHELKTPLTSIIGYADMLRSRQMAPERTAACANYIFTEGKRLESLSFKLMDLIVLDRQSFPLRLVSASFFLKQAAEEFAPIFLEEHIDFSLDAEEAVLQLEPDLMKTVCINLLDNARKAIENNGRIHLTGKIISDMQYCISVTDNGKGIPKDELSKITEAFYMVDKSRSRAQGGAGLGLFLCQKIAELHKGRLEFSCPPEGGTCVSLYLQRPDLPDECREEGYHEP